MAKKWQTQPDEAWNNKQKELLVHFLQSQAWGQFQNKLGRKTFYAHSKNWSWLAIYETGRFGSRLYCPYGPTAKSIKSLKEALQTLTDCAKQQNVTYIRIQPQGPFTQKDLKSLNLQKAHRNIQPRYTLIKDLSLHKDDLISEMTATNRNLYRTAGKKGLSFEISNNPKDVSIFLNLIHEVASKNNITVHKDSYYKTMAEVLIPQKAMQLYIARHENKPVAASLVFDNNHTRYYAHAASSYEARKLHPGSPLLTNMILDAKNKHLISFDFNGIAPPDQPDHRWAGFTKFKKSFGGTPVDLNDTYEYGIKKIPYLIYHIASKISG